MSWWGRHCSVAGTGARWRRPAATAAVLVTAVGAVDSDVALGAFPTHLAAVVITALVVVAARMYWSSSRRGVLTTLACALVAQPVLHEGVGIVPTSLAPHLQHSTTSGAHVFATALVVGLVICAGGLWQLAVAAPAAVGLRRALVAAHVSVRRDGSSASVRTADWALTGAFAPSASLRGPPAFA